MFETAPIAYRYDGTLDGLLCCIFSCFVEKRMPTCLIAPDAEQLPLYPVVDIETDSIKANRVAKGICGRISAEVMEMITDAMCCTDTDGADLFALQTACLGFEVGAGVVDMLTEPCVDRLTKALRHALGEAHLLTGFVRFSEFGGALIATISPKNKALTLIAPHFCDRFARETFMIYDERHKEALVHQRGRHEIHQVSDYQPPERAPREQQLASLWQQYFKAIAIDQRANPTCQRSHMPKRYWAHMVEMQEALCYNDAIGNQGGMIHDTALPPQAHA